MNPLYVFTFFVFFAVPVYAQGTLSYTLTVAGPAPSCRIGGVSGIAFGTHERQASGSDSSTDDGGFTLSGSDVSNFTVSISTLPSSFPNLKVDLDLGWQQRTGSNRYAAISGTTYSGTAGGLWSDFTHDFEIGGTASWDWAEITAAGSDGFTVDVSASCSRTN